MANVLLGVTGSVAAIKTPELFHLLVNRGHQVKIVSTKGALYFFNPVEIDPSRVSRNPDFVTIDDDEWPGREYGKRYSRGAEVKHIELRRWADLFVVAPLDANTLGKMAAGLCDNCLTCVWRAWDYRRPVVIAPAMNTLMWENPMTKRHLRQIASDFGANHVPGHLDGDVLLQQLNERAQSFRIVAPQEKLLACGDVGVGAMANLEEIAQAIELLLNFKRP